jgi:hypothetical protein
MKFYLIIYIVFAFILSACNEGLAPPPPISKSYINGLVTYKNAKNKWPPTDSVKDIRVVAFKNYPPKNIIAELTSGDAFFTASMPKFVDTSSFSIEFTKPPLYIKYLVVAQQIGSIMEWRAIGVYTISGDVTKPDSIYVIEGKSFNNIKINVDFDNLPPQPFQ